jgi:hypothetical protein
MPVTEYGAETIVDWVAEAAKKLLSAAQFANREQVPLVAVIVTVAPTVEHAPLAVMTAVVLALVVAATVKVA